MVTSRSAIETDEPEQDGEAEPAPAERAPDATPPAGGDVAPDGQLVDI